MCTVRVYAHVRACSENILVENASVRHGVGMTIGSVPPNPATNCVRNVTFRNVHFDEPYKAIYVKTNPGENGDGVIANIVYEHMYVNKPIWWGVYIGPQQQEQPDGTGPVRRFLLCVVVILL